MWSKEKFNEALFDRAKLRVREVAAVLQISRVTISRWRHDPNSNPHPLRESAIMEFVTHVERAVDAGFLPLPSDIRGSERLPAIKRLLAS